MRFGLEAEDYNELVKVSEGACWVCGSQGSGKRRLHIDHSHITGEVRGLLCYGCNIALGMVKDDPERLRALADYLERHDNVL